MWSLLSSALLATFCSYKKLAVFNRDAFAERNFSFTKNVSVGHIAANFL
jgi:hypothetical protein